MNFGVQFALGGFPLHVMEEEAADVRAMLSQIRAAPSSLAPPPPAQSVPRLAFSLFITWLFGVPTPLPIQREHRDEGRVPISSP